MCITEVFSPQFLVWKILRALYASCPHLKIQRIRSDIFSNASFLCSLNRLGLRKWNALHFMNVPRLRWQLCVLKQSGFDVHDDNLHHHNCITNQSVVDVPDVVNMLFTASLSLPSRSSQYRLTALLPPLPLSPLRLLSIRSLCLCSSPSSRYRCRYRHYNRHSVDRHRQHQLLL
jgi:hypothetical protein